MFSYAASWGSVVPVVVGEVSSNRLRTKTIAFAMSGNWATSMLVICGAPYLINPAYANIGTKIGFIFGGLAVPLAVFTYFCVPETKDRTLEEIDEMFLKVRLGVIAPFSLTYTLYRAFQFLSSRLTYVRVVLEDCQRSRREVYH
jgi:hypothetical protein